MLGVSGGSAQPSAARARDSPKGLRCPNVRLVDRSHVTMLATDVDLVGYFKCPYRQHAHTGDFRRLVFSAPECSLRSPKTLSVEDRSRGFELRHRRGTMIRIIPGPPVPLSTRRWRGYPADA
jgi:hypothetical protein